MDRIYFIVPFMQREFAKRMGAQWDPALRYWFAETAEVAARMRKHYPEHGSESLLN